MMRTTFYVTCIALVLLCVATLSRAQDRFYVNAVTGHDDFNVAAFNDPTKPFKSVQFVVAAAAQQGYSSVFITTQGGFWTPFDVMGVNVAIVSQESVFLTPFIDSTGSRTGGLTLLGATVLHAQPSTLIGMKNFTSVECNFQLAYPIDVTDAWWTSTRSTYIYNVNLPLSLGFNASAPAMSELVVARRDTAVEFVRDVFLFYDGFVADPELGVTLFKTLDNGNILSDASVWGWEFGYKLPTKRAVVAEAWGSLTDCDASVPQSCGQQRHTSFVLSWNLDTNDIEEIIYAKGHDASIQFHGASIRRLDRLLAVKTKHVLHRVTGKSIVTAIDLDVGGDLEIDWSSNPQLVLEVALTRSKGSMVLAGSLATGVRRVSSCGSLIAQAGADDATVLVNNCLGDAKLLLTAEAAHRGHHLTVFKQSVGKLDLVAASGTKIMGASKWSMGLLVKSVQLQFYEGEWYVLSMF